MSDPEARDLIARTIRDRPGADADLLALDILHILRGHGWRPTAARVEPWQRSDGPAADPERVRDHAAEARAALAGRVASLEAERLRPVPPAPGGGGEP